MFFICFCFSPLYTLPFATLLLQLYSSLTTLLCPHHTPPHRSFPFTTSFFINHFPLHSPLSSPLTHPSPHSPNRSPSPLSVSPSQEWLTPDCLVGWVTRCLHCDFLYQSYQTWCCYGSDHPAEETSVKVRNVFRDGVKNAVWWALS